MNARCVAVVALVGLLSELSWSARPAAANCQTTKKVVVRGSDAVTINATYDSVTDTFDLKIINRQNAWYMVSESHPGSGAGNCWPSWLPLTQSRWLPIPGDRLPAFIAPHGTIELNNVRLAIGDRFGICQVGLFSPGWTVSTDNAVVAALNAIDLIALTTFDTKITDVTTPSSLLAVLSEVLQVLQHDTWAAVWHFAEVAASPLRTTDRAQWLVDLASAAWDIFASTEHAKPLVVDALRTLGIGHPFSVAAKLFKAMHVLAVLRRKVDLAIYAVNMGVAYTNAMWGEASIEVVTGPATVEDPPTGEITKPFEGEVVSGHFSVAGTAADDCSGVHHVNLTYSADNGVSWHFLSQDTSAPYGFPDIDLSAIPDGTTIRLGWDIYDNAGLHANSPSGNRVVVKDTAALAPPAFDADYVADVTIPDGAVLAPGQAFTKTWRIQNTGTSAWTSVTLQFAAGTNLATVTSVALPPLVPGQIGTVDVPMIAPTTPETYRSTWRPMHAGSPFGGTVFALIEVRCSAPGSGTCDLSDRCLNMGCATHDAPDENAVFKTPATGSGVFYARGGYRHAFPTSDCYHLFHDDFSDLACIANQDAAPPNLSPGPDACTDGSFYRRDGARAIYRLESGHLRPLCGMWTSASFLARWGYSFQVAFLVDEAHFSTLTAAYPVTGGDGIYPPSTQAPRCGDPGLQCGDHVDPDGICYGTLHCGGCGANADCLAGTCVARPSELVPGAITSPSSASVDGASFVVTWTLGHSTDGNPTSTALLCRRNSEGWSGQSGFGSATSVVVGGLVPGDVVACRPRTRLDNAWDRWVDGEPTTWTVSDARAAMEVIAIAQLPDSHPNGCDNLSVQATITNTGALPGTGHARAYLHPSTGDETAPEAVPSYELRDVALGAGESRAIQFTIATAQPLPLAASGWAITVVVTDNSGLDPPRRRTVPATGADLAAPAVDSLIVYGRTGSPTAVSIGRSHTVHATVSDDYALASWQLAWRQGSGAWTTAATGSFTAGCHAVEAIWGTWSVPSTLAPGLLIDVRLTVADTAGQTGAATSQVVTIPSGEPSVTITRPAGSPSYVGTTEASPTCVPVEAYVVAGLPVTSIQVGFASADHARHVLFLPVAPVPVDGHVVSCIPASYYGDDLRVFVRVNDAGGTPHVFYSGPIAIDPPPPIAPWGPLVVDTSQTALPPPPNGSFSVTSYGGAWESGASTTLFRQDLVHALDGSTTLDVTRLTVDVDGLEVIAATPWVTHFVDPGPNGTAFTAPLRDDWLFQFDPGPLNGCVQDVATPCDFQPRIRAATASGVTPWRSLTTYPSLAFGDGPFLLGSNDIVRGPSGARFVSIRWEVGGAVRTDLYRDDGAALTRLAVYDPGVSRLATAQGQLWGLRAFVDGSGFHVGAAPISELTGARGAEVVVLSASATTQLWLVARDAADDSLHVLLYDPLDRTVRHTRRGLSGWSASTPFALPTSWRGQAGATFMPLDLVVGGGVVYVRVLVTGLGPSRSELLAFRPGSAPDMDRAFDDVDSDLFPARGLIALSDGTLLRATTCGWNLEQRLCLQRSKPVFASCWDGDACTIDTWDAALGACAPATVQCASDGDACDGPEVCVGGACASDVAHAPRCDDGVWCNGVETCAAATGCAPGTPPVVDDGASCTADSCDEASHTIAHVARADFCVPGACQISTCAPGVPGADPVTGCITAPAPAPSDGLPCTDDLCDPVSGAFIHPIAPMSCVIDGACVTAGAIAPSNPCETCDPTRSQTAWSPRDDGTACDDGAYCTIDDRCASGLCIGRARACPVTGGNGCIAGTCDETADMCVFTQRSDGDSCDDGLTCNGIETCLGGDCQPGAPPSDDGNPCTADRCDEFAGVSHEALTGTPCESDGDDCTVDVCQLGICTHVGECDADTDGSAADGGMRSTSDGGCCGTSRSPTASWSLALLCAAALLRRRRIRARA